MMVINRNALLPYGSVNKHIIFPDEVDIVAIYRDEGVDVYGVSFYFAEPTQQSRFIR